MACFDFAVSVPTDQTVPTEENTQKAAAYLQKRLSAFAGFSAFHSRFHCVFSAWVYGNATGRFAV